VKKKIVSIFNKKLYTNKFYITDIYVYIYRVIQNDCRGFNNLSYTIHF